MRVSCGKGFGSWTNDDIDACKAIFAKNGIKAVEIESQKAPENAESYAVGTMFAVPDDATIGGLERSSAELHKNDVEMDRF